ncbi:MAG: minor capsid protein [Alloprevotella sp.]|nr:minor capsid protein [Alloprevotella sp.]
MDAHDWTDRQLAKLEKKFKREYSQAAKEMRAKQKKALAKYAAEKEAMEKALDDTREAMEAHKRWLRLQAIEQARVGGMVDQLAETASSANRAASEAINGMLPIIYAENANMAAFAVDKAAKVNTMFSLVDADTVRHILGLDETGVLIKEVYEGARVPLGMERVQSIRKAEFDAAKDIRWNRQKFQSAITQGILQGESIPNIVKRTDAIFNSNRKAAVRAARTATTSAENAGRASSYERAERMGIKMVQEWMATLDDRTRDSHAMMDGERVEVGERFSNGLLYPGDPTGDPAEVWNCRCTMRAVVEGYEYEDGRFEGMPSGMGYDDWKASRERDG